MLAAFRVHTASQTASRAGESAEMHRQSLAVLDRYLGRVGEPVRPGLEAAARFSVALNAAMARASVGGQLPWELVPQFLALGPGGWSRYLRDSRMVERLGARLKARLRKPGRAAPLPARIGASR
jgi:hypothetical protein